MLFVPEDVRKKIAEIMKNGEAGDPIETAQRALAIRPGYGPAHLLMGNTLFAAGKLDEAEEVLWEGIRHDPIRPLLYLHLAEVRTKRNQADVLAKRIRHLALWKLSFMHRIPEFLAAMFKPVVGDEAYEPETFERLALFEDIEVEKAKDPLEVVERLRPYRLFNDLQREAPDDLSEDTLQGIIEHAAECEPLLRNALHQWALAPNIIDDVVLSMLIAILGEISRPDALDDLLELATTANKVIFPHVHWAILTLGMRFPQEALDRFRVAARGANVKLRCALADHVDLLEDAEGDVEVLASLLDGFEKLAQENDAPYVLAEVVNALMERGEEALAKSLAAKYESKIPKKERHLVREALSEDGSFMPVLVQLEIDEPDIEGVCLERYFLSDQEEDEDEDEEEEFDDDEFEDPVDLEPPPPKPGRNEPCWCGSGKKYKKCHLAADEEAEREQAGIDEDIDEDVPMTPHEQVMYDVLGAARGWHTKKDVERAQKLYLDKEGKAEISQDEVNGFVEWMLHDYRDIGTRHTAIENYLRTRATKLTRLEREHLESLRDARFGLFEAERIEPGSGVHLHDLGTDERMFVHDVSMSNSLTRWDAILVRIHFESGRWLFVGDASGVPRDLLDPFLATIEEESRAARQSKAEFIRANSHRLHRLVQDLRRDRIAGLKIVNNEGEEVEFVGDRYTGMEEVKRMAMGGTSPPEREPRPPIPPELEREIVLKMKGDHYSQWVNDPLPALKGKTPRQAVQTPEGRKAVIDLLSTLENMEARDLRSGHPAYDVNILRRDLGLPEE